MKKIFLIFISSLLIISSLFTVACSSFILDNKVSVKALTCDFEGASTFNSEQNTISKTVRATIYPANAFNKEVDFFVEWDSTSTLKDQPVSDYVRVEQETDGSLVATVTCYKSFRDNDIILKVISRDASAVVATCKVTYIGISSSMSIRTDLELSYSDTRDACYVLDCNSTYNFSVILTNVFDDVVSNLSYTVEAFGEFYTCDFTTLEDSQGSMVLDVSNIKKETVKYYLFENTDLAFSLENNIFTLNTFDHPFDFYWTTITTEIDPYGEYSSYDVPISEALLTYYDFSNASKDGLIYDYTQDLTDYIVYNNEALESSYLLITISDSISGLSCSFKYFVRVPVSKVVLNNYTVVFNG